MQDATDLVNYACLQSIDDGMKPAASNKSQTIFSLPAPALDMFLRNFTLYLSNSV